MTTDTLNSQPDLAALGAAVLQVDDLHVSVHDGTAMAVRGVSLEVRAGEIVGLVGESGSGKTLTCRAALGVLPPGCAVASGTVRFGGRDVTGLPPRGWRRLHGSQIGAVFQDPGSYLNPSIAVGSQLAEVLRVTGGLPRRAARRRTLELFETVGLREHVYRQIPAELSGGMLQRVMIAIAISCDPALLVADEPTTALDVTVQAEILALLARLREERGLAVLFVSHDLAVVTQLCDRIAVCYAGEVVEYGAVPEVVARPRHPYTEALLRVAIGAELAVIPGQPPTAGAELPGCRFADRCPVAEDLCVSGPVALAGSGHVARCIRVGL
jgi:peptide/nickel transport system ATP-binding protein